MDELQIIEDVENIYSRLNDIEKEKLIKQALKTRILTKLRNRKLRKNKKLKNNGELNN